MNAKERDMQDTRTLGHERQIRTRHLRERVSVDGDGEDVHEHAYAGDHVDELWVGVLASWTRVREGTYHRPPPLSPPRNDLPVEP